MGQRGGEREGEREQEKEGERVVLRQKDRDREERKGYVHMYVCRERDRETVRQIEKKRVRQI